ncbi:MAG: membrane or secreted protein [Bacteroidota bacterium]
MKSIQLKLFFALLLIPAMGFIWINSPQTSTETPTALNIEGAWLIKSMNGESTPEGIQVMRLVAKDYTMFAVYNLEEKQFMGAGGGSYKIEGDRLTGRIDFDTQDTTMIGTNYDYKIEMPDEKTFIVSGEGPQGPFKAEMTRVDDSGNEMAGAYRISGRMRNGEMRQSRPGPRKTIKMLTGTRFQWAAINAKTKQFFGTGGGTYTVKDGKYTENIEFFSRDGSRVGASLEFEASLEGDDWSHKGKSSKGNPIHEIWTRNWNLHD